VGSRFQNGPDRSEADPNGAWTSCGGRPPGDGGLQINQRLMAFLLVAFFLPVFLAVFRPVVFRAAVFAVFFGTVFFLALVFPTFVVFFGFAFFAAAFFTGLSVFWDDLSAAALSAQLAADCSKNMMRRLLFSVPGLK
jgi:hypothetical protein